MRALILFAFLPCICFGQVGINTTSPNAILEVQSSNQAMPTNTDGVLIPKIDVFPAINPTASQNGMLVFLTTDDSFYYWNHNTSSWRKVSTIERIDDLVDGKSDNDGSGNGSSIFLGIDSGINDDETDNRNLGIGYQTLSANTTGRRSIAIGYQALRTNVNGYYNIAIGYKTLENNDTGHFNTILGYRAAENSVSGNNNTAIGMRCLYANNSGSTNTAIGYSVLRSNVTGDGNVAVGSGALNFNYSGSNNTAVGNSTSPGITNLDNTTAIGYQASPNASNQIRIGNAVVTDIGGYANWTNISDRRLKTDIQEQVVGLAFIKKLRPVTYHLDMDAIAEFNKTPDSLRLRDAEQWKTKELQSGFIAQEVEVAANLVGYNFHGVVKPMDDNGTYALRYAEFVVPLVKAVQEQQELIVKQQEELNLLKIEIAKIKSVLSEE